MDADRLPRRAGLTPEKITREHQQRCRAALRQCCRIGLLRRRLTNVDDHAYWSLVDSLVDDGLSRPAEMERPVQQLMPVPARSRQPCWPAAPARKTSPGCASCSRRPRSPIQTRLPRTPASPIRPTLIHAHAAAAV